MTNDASWLSPAGMYVAFSAKQLSASGEALKLLVLSAVKSHEQEDSASFSRATL